MTVAKQLSKRRLGRTGLMVTEMSLGGYMFTGEFHVPQEEAQAIMDVAFDAGINYVDTAAMYGFGEGEELVGRALQRHRDKDIYVSTKVGYLDRTIVRNLGADGYSDEEALRRAILHSMWLLQQDYVDILFVHEPNLKEWWGEGLHTGEAPVLSVLDDLKREGVIGAVGLGGWVCDNIADLLDTGRFDVALCAGGYTLIRQPVRERVISIAKKHDVGLVMGGTFLQGLLATVQRERMLEMQKSGNYGWLSADDVRRILAIYDLRDEIGMSLTEMAIRYILSDDSVHTMIPGAQSRSHVEENIRAALNGPLPAELVGRIDAISRS